MLKSLKSFGLQTIRSAHRDRYPIAIGAIATVYAVSFIGPHIGVWETLGWVIGVAAALAFLPTPTTRLIKALAARRALRDLATRKEDSR